MKVVISAGGTGGHIYPALAIINKIKEMEPGSEFLYIGTHNRMEKDIVPKEGIPFKSVEIYGFNRKNILKNFKTIKCLIKAEKTCEKYISDFKPDVVIGVGGYVTVPVIRAAHKLGIKTVIHEQNSIPGKANLSLKTKVDKIFVSFKSSINSFPKEKTVFTGNPCGDNALKSKKITKEELGLKKNKKLVVIVMGSLGASTINDYLKNNLNNFKDKDYQVLYITGQNIEINKLTLPENVKIFPYINPLSGLLKDTDLIVTRAGASTLSEIISLGIPSILIPSPFVPNNHQYINALDLVNNNSAILLEEKQLTDDKLIVEIDKLINDNYKLKEIKDNLKKLEIKDSSLLIYKNIKELVDRK